MKPLSIALRATWLLGRLIALAWNVLFDLLGMAGRAVLVTFDFVKARRSLPAGTLVCPNGHSIPTEGGTYSCTKCGFVYGGSSASIWICGNPECHAVTPYVNCIEIDCGLSVRNPYRWGRP